MGRDIVSFATLIKLGPPFFRLDLGRIQIGTHPYTISSSDNREPVLSLISFASTSNAARDDSTSRGSCSDLPNIFGKYSGINLPTSRSASVTANGPPLLHLFRQHQIAQGYQQSTRTGSTRAQVLRPRYPGQRKTGRYGRQDTIHLRRLVLMSSCGDCIGYAGRGDLVHDFVPTVKSRHVCGRSPYVKA